MKQPSKAFTLIELLVVIAIIGVLVGGLGVALTKGGDGSTALQGGQSLLASAVSATRGQAILKNQTTALVVDIDPDSDGYMRSFRILTNLAAKVPENTSTNPVTPEIPAKGTASSDPMILPKGVFLVPPSSSFDSDITLASGNNAWQSNRYSTAFDGENITVRNVSNGKFAIVFTITSRGTTGRSGKIILAHGERTAGGIRLLNPDALRGAMLSAYGSLILLNDAESFD